MTEENKETSVEKTSQEATVTGDKSIAEPAPIAENGAPESTTATETAQPAEERKEVRSVLLSSFGGIKSVKLTKIPEPSTVGEEEVAIRVSAAYVLFFLFNQVFDEILLIDFNLRLFVFLKLQIVASALAICWLAREVWSVCRKPRSLSASNCPALSNWSDLMFKISKSEIELQH